MNQIIVDAIKGIIIGGVTATVGYIKSSPTEKIDWLKAVPTVAIGLVVGGIAGVLKVDMITATDYAAAYGATAFINSAWSYINKKWISPSSKNPKK